MYSLNYDYMILIKAYILGFCVVGCEIWADGEQWIGDEVRVLSCFGTGMDIWYMEGMHLIVS